MVELEKMVKEDKKRILVVEDKLSNVANAYEALTNRGYEVDVAFDLSQATKLLDSQKYDGVITDICFEEKGIYFSGYDKVESEEENPEIRNLVYKSLEDKEGLLEFLENNSNVRKQFDASLSNSIYLGCVRGRNSQEKILDIIEVSDNAPGLEEMVRYKDEFSSYLQHSYVDSVERIKEMHPCGNQVKSTESSPAFGYYVVKKANEKGIPVSVISYGGHSRHAISGILASGITDMKELGYHLSNMENFVPNVDLDKDSDSKIIESLEIGRRIVLNKVILSSGEKDPYLYDKALDQVLGNMDESISYKIDEENSEDINEMKKKLSREFIEKRYPQSLKEYDERGLPLEICFYGDDAFTPFIK